MYFLFLIILAVVFASCNKEAPMQSSAGTDPQLNLSSTPGVTLTVTKTAEGYWRKKYDWTIEKTVTPTSLEIQNGATGTVSYTISAVRILASEVYGVSGEICVANTGIVDISIASMTDIILYNNGTSIVELARVAIDFSAHPFIAIGATQCYPYEIDFAAIVSGTNNYKNLVEVTTTNSTQTFFGWTLFGLPTTSFTEFDAEADITDFPNCPAGFTATPANPGPWHLTDSGLITFDVNILNATAMCDTWFNFPNLAKLIESDSGELRQDDALVHIYTGLCSTGCTLTIGYWKTHAGFTGNNPDRVTQYLPIWLGTSGGAKSIQVTTAQQAVTILSMDLGSPSNGIIKLYAQLLGAKLNIANSASSSPVSSTVAATDAFLANYNYTNWSSMSQSTKNMILGWKSTLDNYNNGDLGISHCE